MKDFKNMLSKGLKETSDFLSKKKDTVTETLSESGDWIKEKSNELMDSVSEIEITQLFSASESTDTKYDTMHYFLLPDIVNEGEYILHTHRELPAGIEDSKLKQKRIFHVPDEESFNVLKEMVLKEKSKDLKETDDFQNSTGDVLNSVADSIDRTNSILTGGLITVGSIACLLNPVTGITILAGSLVPNLTGTLLQEITKGLGDKLKKNSEENREKEAENKALKELQKVKPELELNPVLLKIKRSISDKVFNPLEGYIEDEENLKLLSNILISVYEPMIEQENKINDNIKKYIDVVKNCKF